MIKEKYDHISDCYECRCVQCKESFFCQSKRGLICNPCQIKNHESKIAELLRLIQLNHRYHKEGDDSARYSDSELCAENTAALLMAMADDAKK